MKAIPGVQNAAVALTLPQFAAAAAHYRSAHPKAPRLILLDEVFVGVDSDMRAIG